jgi:hypothetical protein
MEQRCSRMRDRLRCFGRSKDADFSL